MQCFCLLINFIAIIGYSREDIDDCLYWMLSFLEILGENVQNFCAIQVMKVVCSVLVLYGY